MPMTKSDPDPAPSEKMREVLAIRADLISALANLERVLEANGVHVESAIITRRERRNLTRRQTSSKL